MNKGLITQTVEIESFEAALSSLGQMVARFGLRLVAAVAIMVIGIWLANRIVASLRRVMARGHLEPSLRTFLISFLNILLKIFVFIIVLATLGVQMTSIIAVLGAASLAVGMALSGTMQNVAGGLVILFFKPFRVGDSIETASGDIGVVKRIMIFTTEIHTFDNQVVYLPNGALANGVITNLSQGAIRRTDMNISIAYGQSVAASRRTIIVMLRRDGRVLDNPPPTVCVSSLGTNAIVLTVRYWTKYEDIAAVSNDMLERIYDRLQKKKVMFPVTLSGAAAPLVGGK